MSRIKSTEMSVIDSAIGQLGIVNEVVSEYDIDDLVQSMAESQALLLQFQNVGSTVASNNREGALPSVFLRK